MLSVKVPAPLPQVGASLRHDLHCRRPLHDQVEVLLPSVELSPELHVYLPPSKAVSSLRTQNTSLVSAQFPGLHSKLISGLAIFIEEYNKVNGNDYSPRVNF